MANKGNKIHNLYISSGNRAVSEKSYDFSIYFDNEDILVNPNEGMNVNVLVCPQIHTMGVYQF